MLLITIIYSFILGILADNTDERGYSFKVNVQGTQCVNGVCNPTHQYSSQGYSPDPFVSHGRPRPPLTHSYSFGTSSGHSNGYENTYQYQNGYSNGHSNNYIYSSTGYRPSIGDLFIGSSVWPSTANKYGRIEKILVDGVEVPLRILD